MNYVIWTNIYLILVLVGQGSVSGTESGKSELTYQEYEDYFKRNPDTSNMNDYPYRNEEIGEDKTQESIKDGNCEGAQYIEPVNQNNLLMRKIPIKIQNQDNTYSEKMTNPPEINKAEIKSKYDYFHLTTLNPLSELPYEENFERIAYEFNPSEFNEQSLRSLLGETKVNGVPHCNLEEYEKEKEAYFNENPFEKQQILENSYERPKRKDTCSTSEKCTESDGQDLYYDDAVPSRRKRNPNPLMEKLMELMPEKLDSKTGIDIRTATADNEKSSEAKLLEVYLAQMLNSYYGKDGLGKKLGNVEGSENENSFIYNLLKDLASIGQFRQNHKLKANHLQGKNQIHNGHIGAEK